MSTINNSGPGAFIRPTTALPSSNGNKLADLVNFLDQSIDKLILEFKDNPNEQFEDVKLGNLLYESLKLDENSENEPGTPNEPGTHFSSVILKKLDSILNIDDKIVFLNAINNKLEELKEFLTQMPDTKLTHKEAKTLKAAIQLIESEFIKVVHDSPATQDIEDSNNLAAKIAKVQASYSSLNP